MKDGPIRTFVKRIALGIYTIDLKVTRAIRRTEGERRYILGGSCNSCGLCCESPVVRSPSPLFYLRSYRWMLTTWHRVINGFELLKIDLRNRHMVFRCTHYDPATKLCDSYHSRPGRCRDYPRNLLTAPRPQFFSECSYFAVDRNAERYRRALERFPITEEKREELFERLYLIEK